MTTTKATRGRPEIPDRDKRSVLVQSRVTEKEKKALKRAADKLGLSLSDWLRQVALENT